jgi:type IV pilus assembly protein PilB
MATTSLKKELGEILIEKGIIKPEVLLNAMDLLSKEENKGRRRLPQLLVEHFKIDRDLVFREVADYYAFRSLDPSKETVDDGVLGFIRKELGSLPEALREMVAENYILPYKVDPDRGGRLLIITPDPTNPEVYKIARAFHYQRFEICYVPMSQWDELWKRVSIDRAMYKDKESEMRSEGFVDETEEDADQYEQALEDEISRSGLVDLVEGIFIDAVRMGASDIHVIPRGEKITEFHLRIDGRLNRWYTHNETRAEAVSAVVKDRAKNLDRFERNSAQDGFAQLIIDKKPVRFRVSVLPLIGKELKNKFESIVIRVLKETTVAQKLEELGFDPYAEDCLRRALKKPYGIIIVTGPTGSGKSTTLVASLRTIMDPSLNILTVEDPVEFLIEGARQIKLNPKLDFEGALRSILRHDPDIVMVGEIRDRLTAEIAIKLANTGHLTLTTLHTNDAPSAVSRLYKMGVEPFLIAYSINMVLAQRLIRKLCTRCKRPLHDPDVEALKRLGLTEEEIKSTKFFKAVGCIDCMKGYKGRMAIHEALYFTKEIRHLILEAGNTVNEDEIRQAALKGGMETLRMRAVELLKQGITTMEEAATMTTEE